MLLMIDNYDSFTYNIVQYIKMLGSDILVIKNDELSLLEIEKLKFDKIIIGPGSGNPNNSGISCQLIKNYHQRLPILGICLGMQCIASVFGGKIIRANKPVHGLVSTIEFEKDFMLFDGIPQNFKATRYHSLMVDKDFNGIKAYTNDQIPMALQIENTKTFGVQFHPEAILTEYGLKIFENFLNLD